MTMKVVPASVPILTTVAKAVTSITVEDQLSTLFFLQYFSLLNINMKYKITGLYLIFWFFF